MQLAKELHNFINACEGFVSSIATQRSLSNDEARIVEYYCKEIVGMIAPSLRESSSTRPEMTPPHDAAPRPIAAE